MVLWRDASRFQPGTDFRAWAYRVAYYQVLAQRRKHGRDRLRFDESLLTILAEQLDSRVADGPRGGKPGAARLLEQAAARRPPVDLPPLRCRCFGEIDGRRPERAAECGGGPIISYSSNAAGLHPPAGFRRESR